MQWVEMSPEKDPSEWLDKMEDWTEDWLKPPSRQTFPVHEADVEDFECGFDAY